MIDQKCEVCGMEKKYHGPTCTTGGSFAPSAGSPVKDHRSELAKARDDWFNSKEGQRCMEATLLKHASDVRFLKNRLETAFLAGVKVGNTQRENNQLSGQRSGSAQGYQSPPTV